MSEELQLIVVEQIKPLELFTAPDKLKIFLDDIDKKAMSIVPDMTTAKGRKDIASIAYKVARTKTTLDDLGKSEVAKLKDLPKKIDAGRKAAREFLDALAERYRQPLTDWEAEEKAKIEAEELAREISRCHGEALEMESFFERERQVAKKEAEFARIEVERKEKEESARIEKERIEREERLKAEAAAKATKEAEEKAAAEKKAADEAIAKAKRDAEEAEQRRIAEAEAARISKENAVREAERKAREEADRKERDRIAEIERARIAEEKKAANKKHREKIKKEACRHIKGIYGVTQEQAEGIFDAISTGDVPHISVSW